MNRKLLLVVAGTLIFAFLLGILYFNATPKPILVRAISGQIPAVTDPSFRRTVDKLLESDISAGNSIELLRNGEEYFPAMLEAISLAEHSITLETYEYFGDEAPALFAQALAERARQGVAVHFLADYVGSIDAEPWVWDLMEEAGVQVERWRKPGLLNSARFNHRTHRKLLVIDGRTAFTGGANIADPWQGHPRTGGYRENHFRVHGPLVGYLQTAFLDNWLRATGTLLLGESYFPALEAVGELEAQIIISSPREGQKRIRLLYLLAIGGATEHLRLATAYFYPDRMMVDALLDARARGVEIDILMPDGDSGDFGWVHYASQNRWKDLLKAGVRIHQFESSMYHAKAIIVDDVWTTIGSANFDNRSFRINDETNVNVFDQGFAQQMSEQFDQDLKYSTLYDLERWRQRPWHQRAVGGLGNLIGPHL